MSEWLEWYEGYESASSGLPQRLREVRRQIHAALDRSPGGPVAVISMCAGDGRDLLGILPSHPRRADVRSRLVELEPELVARGRARAREAGCSVDFVLGDASTTSAYAGAVPADIVLVCGVFGNIPDADVRGTINHLPELCAADATVVWTRSRRKPDLTPAVRAWFAEAGFEEVAFSAISDSAASVGVHRLTTPPRSFQPGIRLFTFLDKSERSWGSRAAQG